eukprot:680857-Prorocentrum_minimum.AAC.1
MGVFLGNNAPARLARAPLRMERGDSVTFGDRFSLNVHHVALSIPIIPLNVHHVALSIPIIPLNVHRVALSIHNIPLNVHRVALSIHNIPLNVHRVVHQRRRRRGRNASAEASFEALVEGVVDKARLLVRLSASGFNHAPHRDCDETSSDRGDDVGRGNARGANARFARHGAGKTESAAAEAEAEAERRDARACEGVAAALRGGVTAAQAAAVGRVQRVRAALRRAGLHALATLLRVAHGTDAHREVLQSLVEEVARTRSGHCGGGRHYGDGIELVEEGTLVRVREAFYRVYDHLAAILHTPGMSAAALVPALAAWDVGFLPGADYAFLLRRARLPQALSGLLAWRPPPQMFDPLDPFEGPPDSPSGESRGSTPSRRPQGRSGPPPALSEPYPPPPAGTTNPAGGLGQSGASPTGEVASSSASWCDGASRESGDREDRKASGE